MSLLTGIFENQKLHIDNYDKNKHKNKIKCIACNNLILAKKGSIYAHHYAHHTNDECVIKRDKDIKTKWHMMWQNISIDCFIEKIITKNNKTYIADIVNDDDIIIEIQSSTLSLEDIQSRENFYNNLIWILNGNDAVKVNNNNEEHLCIRSNLLFTTTNNYLIVKFTKKFWRNITKPKYVDVGDCLYKIITYIDNDFYICQILDYTTFFNIYFNGILKKSSNETNEIILNGNKYPKDEYIIKKIPAENFNNFNTKQDVFYSENDNSFYGYGTYDIRGGLYKLGYRFDKYTKKWIF